MPDGRPLIGVAQANVRREGASAACEGCHRRSGYGISEGALQIRSITGPALFGEQAARPLDAAAVPPIARPVPVDSTDASRAAAASLRNARLAAFTGTRQRPPYDDASLARALRNGIDVTGREMDPGMPRYALDDGEMSALVAYLRTLSAQSAPGITEEQVHFATVIQPGVDATKRRAMLDILQSYIEDRNAGLRAEARRERAGLVRLGRTYREWVLHVWDLSGGSDTWGGQLEALYTRQPVFALIGGLGNTSWLPIHEFSERFKVPCVLPQTELPVVENFGYYTVYLSKGITLEAKALAKFLEVQDEPGTVIQVFRRGEPGAVAADAFRKEWKDLAGRDLQERVLEASPLKSFWQALATESPRATLILWLSPPDLAETQALTGPGSQVRAIYLSSTLTEGTRTDLAAGGDDRVRWVYPQDLPQTRETRLRPVKVWLQSKGIAPGDEKVQMNAYLAVTVTTAVMSHGMDAFSREFLLERIEHRMGNAYETSIYPHPTLGPGQRYASKGAYIVQAGGPDDRQLKALSAWIVP